MAIDLYRTFTTADMTIRFLLDEASGQIGMVLFPSSLEPAVVERRETLAGCMDAEVSELPIGDIRAWNLDPLVHVSCVGDASGGGFGQGVSMRGSSTTFSLKFVDQDHDQADGGHRVTTTLKNDAGLEVRHVLGWKDGDRGLRNWSEITNAGSNEITLQMITSFNLGHLSPFAVDDAPERLWVHRFRSFWSSEGRHDVRRVEELELGRSWLAVETRCERFGQMGSMPVRKWFPFVALEDREAGVFWGAQLAWSGSWQMEVARQHDLLSLSGGLADREFGHWMKKIRPGDTFTTPEAVLSCVAGDVDSLCDRLTSMQREAADRHPEVERDLPVMFNEWCSTWGEPNHEILVRMADALKDTRTKYLIIDAGWYCDAKNWGAKHGDWIPVESKFPDGLKATCDAIRERGLIPGLWFEMETIGPESEAARMEEMQVKRDGFPVRSGGRRFWDMRKEEVQAHLEERVIDQLEEYGVGYLKVDYNESIGMGVDGAESLGEGLRQCIEGTHRFFRRMRERLPDLVIENCSSGGHRLEPAMIGLTAVSSFSDVHEGRDIPIVAANVQRLILPRQSQIWAVLHASESTRRTNYSLAATFLGRMCISGEVWELSGEQREMIRKAHDLYALAVPTLKEGRSKRYGPEVINYRYPRGWQAVIREGTGGKQVVAVVHRFEDEAEDIVCPLPDGAWEVAGELVEGNTEVVVGEKSLTIKGLESFAGVVVVLEGG